MSTHRIALERLASDVRLAAPESEALRLRFGLACIERVEHLLEDDEVRSCVNALRDFVDGRIDAAEFERAGNAAASLANHHPGSKSIDGCGHAAVSASYAVAKALAGKALEAASYAAYAVVYAQSGYGGVNDPAEFEPELAWQVHKLEQLAAAKA